MDGLIPEDHISGAAGDAGDPADTAGRRIRSSSLQ